MLNLREAAQRRFEIGAPSFEARRREALAFVEKSGLPTRRVEAWHYTDFAQLLAQGETATAPSGAELSSLSPYQIVYDDAGWHLSADIADDPAVSVTPLWDADPAIWSSHLSDAPLENVALAHNMALLDDGLILRVSGRPAHPICLSYRTQAPRVLHLVLDATPDSDLCVVEHYAADNLLSVSIDLTLAQKARVEHAIIHDRGPLYTLNQSQLSASAHLDRHYLAAAPDMARHESYLALNDVQSTGRLTGMMVLGGQTHCDITTVVDHKSGESYSDTQVRSVLSDQAHGIFQGKILVRPDAQHIEADQGAKTLLASTGAEMSVKPELEIFADDVVCSHGATIGQVDGDALFFLRARGVPEAVARQLLISAFMSSGLSRIQHDGLRDWLTTHIEHQVKRASLPHASPSNLEIL